MRTVITYLALAVLIAALLGYVGPARDIWALKSHAATVGGVIERATCEDHATVHYKFMVAGRSYLGRGVPGVSPCSAATVGQVVKVYYLSENPGISMLKEPGPEWKNEVGAIASAALLFPALIIWSYRRRYRNDA